MIVSDILKHFMTMILNNSDIFWYYLTISDSGICLPTLRWYHAANHFEDAMDFAQTWSGQREYHGLDLFGFSEGLSFLYSALVDFRWFIYIFIILYNSVCVFCFLLIFFDFIAGFVDRLGLLRRQLRRAGRRSLSYDIKLNEAHDLSSKSGFYILLGMGLMFLAFLVLVVQKCLEF
jgi:hypothetical protein